MSIIQKPFLVILCGIPCSGKSTFSGELAQVLEKEGYRTVIVSSDDFRNMRHEYIQKFDGELEQFVRDSTYTTIENGLKRGLVVISDDTNYYSSIRRRLIKITEKTRASYAIVYVNTPLETAIKWNNSRISGLPNKVIEEIHSKLDTPGSEYKWDRPFHEVNLETNELKNIAELVATNIIKKIESKKTIPKHLMVKNINLDSELNRETRRAISELLKRVGDYTLAPKLTELRKRVVKEAKKEGYSSKEAVSKLLSESQNIVRKNIVVTNKNQMHVHVGLFGHVDHGKTKIAECLSEKLSTASLDKHPEAKRRGMSIDLGFSAFNLHNYLVTLVDQPGHFSLIKHVMAGASIIDAAILVIAANEGPQVQTLEHFSIINSLEIECLIVALNKTDLVSKQRIEAVKKEIRSLLADTRYNNSPILEVSAVRGIGIEDLKEAIYTEIKIPVREWIGSLKMPISHSFNIPGIGTVSTGTILRGKVLEKDLVDIIPPGKTGRVKFIQIFSEKKNEAVAGDRAAIALTNIRAKEISRGSYITTPGSLKEYKYLDVKIKPEKGYKRSLKTGSIIHINIGMQTVTGKIYPYQQLNELKISKKRISRLKANNAIISLIKEVPVEIDDKVLLTKLDLPPKEFRIIGVADVSHVSTMPIKINSVKIKTGNLEKTYSGYLVHNLFASDQSVNHLKGQLIVSESQIKGFIGKPVGKSGSFQASFDKEPNLEEKIYYYIMRDVKID